ncbi:MAG TPA: HAD-IA family hydrolase [Terracidiphilus sp.]|jgi:putative hydrolase of the HAD superfamily|nr:HAD-IA family hydrolase [Terracidiphilus sp.]
MFPPTFPFDVILFDVGGVLLTNGWDTGERALAVEHFELDEAGFEARHREAYPAWERGAVAVQTYLDATVFNEPRSFSLDEFFAFMVAQSQLLPDGALGTLKELAASNKCMLGALNNEARETNEYRFKKFGLRNYFQVALSSCSLGVRKPEMGIYQRALDILGRPAERILFIDDRTENVAAAVEAGMRGIHFAGESGLRRELAGLGVL